MEANHFVQAVAKDMMAKWPAIAPMPIHVPGLTFATILSLRALMILSASAAK